MSSQPSPPRRIAQVVYLRPEYLAEYKACHAAVWPDVLAQIKDSNIADCTTSLLRSFPLQPATYDLPLSDSIFLVDIPRPTLFAMFKYVGNDWESDMARMAANPKVQEWWDMTDRMQESPLPGAEGSKKGPWWKEAEEVFYLE
jgi:L-rhamnose mutarotase